VTNFKQGTLTASLLYDCEPRREVTLLRSSPIETVIHLSSNGEEVTVEVRIHVLTSQHEDSLFRICVKYQEEEIISEPLKVISKADTVRKSKDKSPCSPSSTTSQTTTNKKKRNATDAFGDTLYRIEQQQKEQQKIIDILYQQNALLVSQLKPQTQQPTPPASPPPLVQEADLTPTSSTESCSPRWNVSRRSERSGQTMVRSIV